MWKSTTLDQHFGKCAEFSTLLQKHSQGVDIVIEMTDDSWQQMKLHQAKEMGRVAAYRIRGMHGHLQTLHVVKEANMPDLTSRSTR